MICRCNVGHASTCNTVGQTAGFFLGYVLFLALESPYFCNKYLRYEPQETGLVTLASFLLFWGWIFIITTTFIALLKHEKNEEVDTSSESKGVKDIVNAYQQLYAIVKLPAVRTLALVLFTAKVNFNHKIYYGFLLFYDNTVELYRLILLNTSMPNMKIFETCRNVFAPYFIGKFWDSKHIIFS